MITLWKKSFSGDSVNPLLLKELRQFFHNKQTIPIFFLLQSICMASLLFIGVRQWFYKESPRIMTVLPQVTCLIFSLFIAVVFCFQLLLKKRQEKIIQGNQLEQLTSITPEQIVNGKLLSLLLWLLFYFAPIVGLLCIATPLMSISANGLLLFSGVFFLFIFAVNTVLLCMINTYFFHVEKIVGAVLLIILFNGFIHFLVESFTHMSLLMIYVILCNFLPLAYALMYSAVLPPQANRAFAPRLTLLVVMLFNYAAAIIGTVSGMEMHMPKLPAYFSLNCAFFLGMGVNLLLFLPILCERNYPTRRQILERPAGRLRIFLWFLFSSGKAPALVYALFMFALQIVFGFIAVHICGVQPFSSYTEVLMTMRPIGFMAFYCMIAWIISLLTSDHNPWFRNSVHILLLLLFLVGIFLIFMQDVPEIITCVVPSGQDIHTNFICSIFYALLSFIIFLVLLLKYFPRYFIKRENGER